MNPKSSYISSELFFQWLKTHFTPRKPAGKVLLLMDGHSSHQSSIDMLNFANENDIILVCLPSHTTQALQPLDRSFFKPFKTFFKKEATNWLKHNKIGIKKIHSGTLIGNAWIKSATAEIAINGFKACGIFPLNRNAIPEYYFHIADSSVQSSPENKSQIVDTSPKNSERPNPILSFKFSTPASPQSIHQPIVFPSTSQNLSPIAIKLADKTPTKYLKEVSPLPVLHKENKKRKQSARILDKEFIENKNRCKAKSSKVANIATGLDKPKQRKTKKGTKSSSECEGEAFNHNSSEDENSCLECLENYYKTKSAAEWIQCIDCKKWMHETCTIYDVRCNICGRKHKIQNLK